MQQIIGTWHKELPLRKLLALRLANMHSFGGRLEQNLVADHSFPRDLIIDDTTVLRAVEPSQIRFLHFLAIAHVREFIAAEADKKGRSTVTTTSPRAGNA